MKQTAVFRLFNDFSVLFCVFLKYFRCFLYIFAILLGFFWSFFDEKRWKMEF
jgi:hypothetical protein